MGWPQVVYIGLIGLNLGCALALHGKPRTGKHSVWASLLGTAIVVPVLYAGGFFTS